MSKAKWTYNVAENQTEAENGNFLEVFETEEAAEEFIKTNNLENAIIFESEYLSLV